MTQRCPSSRKIASSLLMIFVSILYSSVGVETCSAEKFAWKFKAGDRLKATFRQVTHQETTVNVEKAEIDLELKMEMTWDVVSVDDSGTANITQQFTRLEVDITTPGVGKAHYDSAAQTPPFGAAATIAKNMAVFLKGDFLVRMTARGEIVSVTASDELLEQIRQVRGSSSLRGLITKEGISETLLQTSAVFPTQSIAPNESWKVEREINSPLGKGTQELTYTYVGMKDIDEQSLAEFKVQSKFKLAPSKLDPNSKGDPLPAKISAQKLTGSLFFDVENGRFVKSEVQEDMTTETPYREMTIVAKGTSTLTMELVPID